eukprot:6890203-Prymnesium_polylepis.1
MEGELRDAVGRRAHLRIERDGGAEVEDAPAAALEPGQEGLRQGERSDDVHPQRVLKVRDVELAEGCGITDRGVVHEQCNGRIGRQRRHERAAASRRADVAGAH